MVRCHRIISIRKTYLAGQLTYAIPTSVIGVTRFFLDGGFSLSGCDNSGVCESADLGVGDRCTTRAGLVFQTYTWSCGLRVVVSIVIKVA